MHDLLLSVVQELSSVAHFYLALFNALGQSAVKSEVKKGFQPSASQATSTEEWIKILQDTASFSCIIASTKPDADKFVGYSYLPEWRVNDTTKCQILSIEKATIGQGCNPLWKLARTGRITASVFHEVSAKISRKSQQKQVNNFPLLQKIMGQSPSLAYIKAVKYGTEMENQAKEAYRHVLLNQGHINLMIRDCGLFIDADRIYLGASPDLVVSCSCFGEELAEIKCPFTNKDIAPATHVPNYIEKHDRSSFQLKRSHSLLQHRN